MQQQGDRCDGRLVQASPSDASRLEYCSMFLQCVFSFVEEEESSDTNVAGVAVSGGVALVKNALQVEPRRLRR